MLYYTQLRDRKAQSENKKKGKKKMTNTKKATTKKENKKAAAEKVKSFLEYTQDGKTTQEALNLTRMIREKFRQEAYMKGDNATMIQAIANRWGYSRTQYDFLASFPLKSDIAKIRTIAPFENKTRETLTARMAAAIVIAYLNRETDDTFYRVFPSGLFLENGCLTDLITGGYIKHKDGEEEKQSFSFAMEKIKNIIQSKEYKALEKTMADACQI